MPNFKPAFKVIKEDRVYTNDETYATFPEANASGEQRYRNWSQCEGWKVIETDEPVTRVWDYEGHRSMFVETLQINIAP